MFNFFQKKLFNKYRDLFVETNLSKHSSLMGYGLKCGRGWNKIIKHMSHEMNYELTLWKKKNKPSKKQIILYIYHRSYAIFLKTIIKKFDSKKSLHRSRTILSDYHYTKSFSCSMPRFSQIRERFGSLHICMNGDITSNMIYIIRKYEKISQKTCESCGKESKLVKRNGYLTTVCDECEKRKNINFLVDFIS